MGKKFTSEAMKHIHYLSWAALTRDGDRTAYVESTGDEESGLFQSKIYIADHCLFAERQSSEKQPIFAHDGNSLYYTSDTNGEFQVYVMELASGAVRQITTMRHGVRRYALSDDGSKIVFECTLWPEELTEGKAGKEMNPEEKAAWEEELDWRPYYITDLTYKLDDWYGMRKGEFSHIGTIRTDGMEQRVLNLDGMEGVYPVWSHCGQKLAFYGYPYDGAKGRQPELFVCGEDGSQMTQMSEDLGIYADNIPMFTMDDESIIVMAFPPFEDGSCIELPYRIDLSNGKGELLIGEWDEEICHGVHPMTANRTEYGENPSYFTLTKDGKYMYFQSGFQGRGNIYRVALAGDSEIELVMAGKTDIFSFAMSENGHLAHLMGNAGQPPELYLDGNRLTHSNDWLADYDLGRVEEFWTKSRDGAVNLQWFLVYPAGYEEGKKYPAVLDIKGGPETVYNLNFWHEFQALSGRDFAVIYGNPRGSTGFGRKFCADAVCWMPQAMEDMLAIVDAAVDTGIIDKTRIGVTGGSYGGYMTNKLIGRTDYFAAAVTQRCLDNPATSYGTGDMGFISAREVPEDFKMLDYLVDRARGNIISYIDHFKVPLLILHGFQDYRCSYEQAEQLFIAMKERNPEVPVRLVMFPEENHGLTRTGKLYNQIRHLSELVGWFDKYLNEGGEKDE